MADQSIVVRAHTSVGSRLTDADAKVRWFWLSFVDPALPDGYQHLGCTIVEAHDLDEAIAASQANHVNPGGKVEAIEIEDDGTLDQTLKVAFMLNRLRTRAEMEAEGIL